MLRAILIAFACLSLLTPSSMSALHAQQPATQDSQLQLTLPPAIYATPGVKMNVYFDNIVETNDLDSLSFQVGCPIGSVQGDHWTVLPTAENVGTHDFSLSIFDSAGKLVSQASSKLRIAATTADYETSQPLRLLIIGDSLTHASHYSNELARLLSLPGNPAWTMLGTHRPASAQPNVAHEGYGGWTWQRFAAHHEPNPDGTYRKRSSPFVFLNSDNTPQLDCNRYFDEHCEGVRPDVIIIKLGINDCFSAPADDPAGIDARIDAMFSWADKLIANLHLAAPKAHIGICLTTPGNARDTAFTANYKDRYPRAGWERIQHRLVQRQIEYVAKHNSSENTDSPQMSLIPTQLNLDTVAGYPENNAVHPNPAGYQQIGRTIYSWLKWQLANP